MAKLLQWLKSPLGIQSMKRIFFLALIGWFVLTHLPADKFPEEPIISDKLVHWTGYFILCSLACAAFHQQTATIIKAMVFLCFFAAFDEWSQQFVMRHPSFNDFAFDFLGIASAVTIFFVLIRRKYFSPQK